MNKKTTAGIAILTAGILGGSALTAQSQDRYHGDRYETGNSIATATPRQQVKLGETIQWDSVTVVEKSYGVIHTEGGYPGTKFILYTFQNKAGEKLKLAYCPEEISYGKPGLIKFEMLPPENNRSITMHDLRDALYSPNMPDCGSTVSTVKNIDGVLRDYSLYPENK
jgi:hypothetical protein